MPRTFAIAVAAACVVIATVSANEPLPHTQETVLIEEFTAEWCGPCVPAYWAMRRAKERWGDAISPLTYSMSDIYTNQHGEQRGNEVRVFGLPSFLFQGTYFHVGTPSDQQIDQHIVNSQNLPRKGRIIGRYHIDRNRDRLSFGINFQADVNLSADHELRIVIHESEWKNTFSNGLTQYEHHVIEAFYEPIGPMQRGRQTTIVRHQDFTGHRWLQNWDNVGVSVYLHDRSSVPQRSVEASWELGLVNIGDLNGDLSITRQDGVLFQRAMGSRRGEPNFNEAADWDRNGIIDSRDRALFLDYIRSGGMR